MTGDNSSNEWGFCINPRETTSDEAMEVIRDQLRLADAAREAGKVFLGVENAVRQILASYDAAQEKKRRAFNDWAKGGGKDFELHRVQADESGAMPISKIDATHLTNEQHIISGMRVSAFYAESEIDRLTRENKNLVGSIDLANMEVESAKETISALRARMLPEPGHGAETLDAKYLGSDRYASELAHRACRNLPINEKIIATYKLWVGIVICRDAAVSAAITKISAPDILNSVESTNENR